MAFKQWLAAATLTAFALSPQSAEAYPIRPTGQTLASPRLVVDVVNRISAYSKDNGGCAFVFSVDMAVMSSTYRPAQPTISVARRGGHYEQWTVNACAAKQVFQVAMWPAPDGGADYAVTPLTGRMPLYVR